MELEAYRIVGNGNYGSCTGGDTVEYTKRGRQRQAKAAGSKFMAFDKATAFPTIISFDERFTALVVSSREGLVFREDRPVYIGGREGGGKGAEGSELEVDQN